MLFKTPPIGIDISDSSIKAVRLTRFRKIAARARATLPVGVIVNGVILEPDNLEEALTALMKNIGAKNVEAVISLPKTKVFLGVFETKSENLTEESIIEEIEECLGSSDHEGARDVSNLFYDFFQMEERKILYGAVNRAIVSSYVDVLRHSGIRPISFEENVVPVGRALLRFDGEPEIVVDIGAEITVMGSYSNHEKLKTVSHISSAGNHIASHMQERLKISQEDIFQTKEPFGKEYLDALREGLAPILKELSLFTKFAGTNHGEPINILVITGGGSLIPGVPEILKEVIQKKIALGNPLLKLWITKDFSSKNTGSDLLFYTNAIGLALRSLVSSKEVRLNLLPTELRTSEKGLFSRFLNFGEEKPKVDGVKSKHKKVPLVVGIIILLIAILASYFTWDFIRQKKLEKEKSPESVSPAIAENTY